MQRLGQVSSSVSLYITNCCGPGPGVEGGNVGVRAERRQEGSKCEGSMMAPFGTEVVAK